MPDESLDIFVFIDALGWRLAQRYQFLSDLLPHRHPVQTLPGYSCTCDPSILTGCYPEDHGHFSFFVKAAPGASPFKRLGWLSWLPDGLACHHRIRHRLSRWVGARLGCTGYFQLYSVPFACLPWLDYTERRDLYEPGGIIGGQPVIFDRWRRSGLAWHKSDWRSGDEACLQDLETRLARPGLRLAYLFTAGLDAVMHRWGPFSPQADQACERLAGRLRRLMDLARRCHGPVRMHCFSDHGMTETRSASRMMKDFDSLRLRYGRDYVAVWDSTMARFWFHSEAVRRTVVDWMGARTEGRWLGDDEWRAWRCHFPDHRYGELTYLLNPGIIFAPSHMNRGWVAGMHGYHPDDEDSTACWLSNHPGPPPVALPDIYRIMAAAAAPGGLA